MTNRSYRRGIAGPDDVPIAARWAFQQRIERSGGHLIWTGAVDNSSTPVFTHANTIYPALRVAWVLHYPTAPEGIVRSSCSVRLCVAGRCLTDAAARQREHLVLAAILGVDISGTCMAGHPSATYGTVRLNGKVECRPCDAERRRNHRALEKAAAA